MTAETPELSSPTQDERTMAILAHVLQLVGWWIAPLIIFLIRRQSRFVSFHALQALLLQIIHALFSMTIMFLWFAVIFSTVLRHPHSKEAPAPVIFFVFPFIWLAFMGVWILMLAIGVTYGIKAGKGEWAEYPVLGPLARKILKLGPNGTPLRAAV